MRASLIAAVLLASMAGHASSARACDEAGARRAAASVRAAVVAGAPPRERGSECVSVSVSGPELGAPSLGAFVRAGCTAVAFAYRWTVVRSETCGMDVHYPIEAVGGVAVLERSGGGLRVVARGPLDPTLLGSLDLAPPADEDGDGRQEIVKARPHSPGLGSFALEVRGRAVRPLSERDVSRPSRVADGATLILELEPAGMMRVDVTAEVLAISPPDALGVVRVELGGGRALRVRVPPPIALPLAVGDSVDVELARHQPSAELPADVVVRSRDGRVLLLHSASGAAIAPFTVWDGRHREGVRVATGNLGAELAPGRWRAITTSEGMLAISGRMFTGPTGAVRTYSVVRVRRMSAREEQTPPIR